MSFLWQHAPVPDEVLFSLLVIKPHKSALLQAHHPHLQQ
uniref:Uncharacterized protein n=1 Tax=Anguilla anguilla TaxID=7936 RepID=A0A0E9T2R1_ANGAN